MKRILITMAVLIILQGCSRIKTTLIKSDENDLNIKTTMTLNDIEGWDIDIDEIESVVIHYIYSGGKDYFIELEDGLRLIEAFNAIQSQDIYRVYEDDLYGIYKGDVKIKLKNSEAPVWITYEPLGYIKYKGTDYSLRYQIEFFEVMREIDEKYNIKLQDYENWFIHSFSNGYAVAEKNNIILIPSKNVNEVLEGMGSRKRVSKEITFNDILEEYRDELELNDIIETKLMNIQIIEMNSAGEVVAISVEIK